MFWDVLGREAKTHNRLQYYKVFCTHSISALTVLSTALISLENSFLLQYDIVIDYQNMAILIYEGAERKHYRS